jgi:hypothetical protein
LNAHLSITVFKRKKKRKHTRMTVLAGTADSSQQQQT